MNIINTVCELTNISIAISITHDEEVNSTLVGLDINNVPFFSYQWGQVTKGQRKVQLGATSHGLSALYLHLHHNVIDSRNTDIAQCYLTNRDEILAVVRDLGVIFNGTEWIEKLDISHYRLAIEEQFPGETKAVMVLTSKGDEHRAAYTFTANNLGDLMGTGIKRSETVVLSGHNSRFVHDYASTVVPPQISDVISSHADTLKARFPALV